MKKSLLLAFIILAFAGCKGDKSSSDELKGALREDTFSDSAVTYFDQVSGLAQNRKSPLSYLLNTAYAIDGNIRCFTGSSVSFELEALGESVLINTKCNSEMDLKIRQGLLQSLAGKRVIMEWAGGADARSTGRVITFRPQNSFWGKYDNVASGAPDRGHQEDMCKDSYIFNESAGTVTIELDVPGSTAIRSDSAQYCLDNEFLGATQDEYRKVLNFRFKDGKLEFHHKADFPNDNDLNRLCVDENADNQCDAI